MRPEAVYNLLMSVSFRYEELAGILRTRISNLPSGTRLPSVRSLIKRYSVSLPTINSALRKLEDEKLIVRAKRKGVYVSDNRAEKLILFHRSYCPSSLLDRKECSLQQSVQNQGWKLLTRRHRLEEPLDSFNGDFNACAHVVTDELSNLKSDLLIHLLTQKVPLVVIDREAGDIGIDHVCGNEHQIITVLVKHLYDLGHQRLALLLNETETSSILLNRVQILRDIATAFALPAPVVINCHTEPGQESALLAYTGLLAYLRELKGALPFTALLVSSAAGGPGALRALHEANIAVPSNCSVATIGTSQINSLLVPSVTEAGDTPDLFGDFIVNILKQRFEGDKIQTIGVKLPASLRVGESTAAPLSPSRANTPSEPGKSISRPAGKNKNQRVARRSNRSELSETSRAV